MKNLRVRRIVPAMGLSTLTLGVAALAAPVFAADAPKMEPFVLSKDCSQYSGAVRASARS
jgi:hypothetical protein